MKNTLLWSVILLMAGAIVTSCSNDKTDGPITEPSEGTHHVVIYDAGSLHTRATSATQPPTAAEQLSIANPLGVHVFDATPGATGGHLQTTQNLTFTGTAPTYTSAPFKVPEGNKWFYVFANVPNSTPAQASQYTAFETRQLDLTFTGTGTAANRPTELATDNSFAIGTLWRAETALAVSAVPTPAANVSIGPISIGRLATKVELESVTIDTEDQSLAGTQTGATYTLRSVPNRMYLVGQYEGTMTPSQTRGTKVLSIVHDEVPVINNVQNPIFVNYADANVVATSIPVYAVENTGALIDIGTGLASTSGLHYYGNTTYIQMSFVYTPVTTEIHDNTTGSPGASLAAGTNFWTADFLNGTVTEKRIYNGDPTDNVQGVSNAAEHAANRMYYNFAVRDPNEDLYEFKNRILRNHSYTVRVTDVLNYGLPQSQKDPDPSEPIPGAEADVEVEVSVSDWHHVVYELEL